MRTPAGTLVKWLAVVILTCAYARSTTVTATVKDTNGNPYANGTVSAFSIDQFGNPASSTTPVPTDASGHFSVTLAPATYKVTVCAPPVNIGPTGNPTPTKVCTQTGYVVISGSSQDISTQLNASAPILGPSLSTFLGANNVWTNINTFQNSGVFTTGQMNFLGEFLLNGLNPLVEYQAENPGVYSTNALIGGVAIPVTSAVQSASGVSGFMNNSAGASGTVGFGGYFQARGLVNGSRNWGANISCMDLLGLTTSVYCNGLEVDVIAQNAPSAYGGATGGLAGIDVFLFAPSPGLNYTGMQGVGVYSGGINKPLMGTAFYSNDGAAPVAFIAGLSAQPGPSVDSQQIQWVMEDAGSNRRVAISTFRSTGILEFALPSAVANSALKVLGGFSAYGTGTGAPACTIGNVGVWLNASDLRAYECSNAGVSQMLVMAGVDVNNANQVVATHLAAPLSTAQGGTAQNSTAVFPTSGTVTITVASGTAVMTTAAIGAGACGSTVTVAATGTATTDSIAWAYNSPPAANPAQLVISQWPTASNVNFQYCNPSAGSITPSAATLNWRVTK